MKIDLSCPVEPRGYELTYDDLGRVRAAIHLFNLSSRRVCALEGVVRWHCGRSGESLAAPFEAGGLRAAGRSGFRIALSSDVALGADQVELNFTRVMFDDGQREWRAGNGIVVDVHQPEPLPGIEQHALFAVAGESAVRFPERDGQVWTCVCGRANPLELDRCVRCARMCADVFANFTRERVLNAGIRAETVIDLDDTPLDERRDMRRRERALRERFLAKRRALIRRMIFAGAAVAALIVLGILLA